ncbi:RNA polymerase sigma factor RpoE [Anatilimnocola aggregata]|uniref:RNA polymerase sigma factor RpoE n=1 Tax=Anatilimnocola aggregata TaxID=2528021 RepID=A0A517YDP7_9BACT|nr:sigma-70 family RNA polymerase sigma factor [Anatilimnocola aggregata]QDU28367.1 RNA polymerase sigma factor RpoE [Anatilimnocola aggregata]
MNTTSLSLLDRLSRGSDQAAWSRFVDLYTPLLLAWCKRLGLSDADSADLMQTVFVTLCEKLPAFRYDPAHSFRAWLKTVLLNSWRNQARKQRSGTPGAAAALDPDQLPDTDPRLQLDEAEYRSHLVRRALAMIQEQFEPTTARACWEFVVEERPAQEVADELGISVNSVYLAKSRVLRHLRQELRWLL